MVNVRHVLDHLPDFEPAMEQAISVSRRLAVFVFFLTPRTLPFGVRKLDPGFNRPAFYTYIYSRPAINHFLTQAGMHWRWYDNLGVTTVPTLVELDQLLGNNNTLCLVDCESNNYQMLRFFKNHDNHYRCKCVRHCHRGLVARCDFAE